MPDRFEHQRIGLAKVAIVTGSPARGRIHAARAASNFGDPEAKRAFGFIPFAVERTGISRNDKRLARALRWLEDHQNSKEGYWDARSLNKQFPQGSMEIQFMRDAATSFATLALLDFDPSRRP